MRTRHSEPVSIGFFRVSQICMNQDSFQSNYFQSLCEIKSSNQRISNVKNHLITCEFYLIFNLLLKKSAQENKQNTIAKKMQRDFTRSFVSISNQKSTFFFSASKKKLKGTHSRNKINSRLWSISMYYLFLATPAPK